MSSTIKEEEEGQQQKLVNCAANTNTTSTTINNSKNYRCKGSDVICNLSQFLTLVVSLSTLVLLLVMTFLATGGGPNDDGQNSQQFVPPRPDVAIWLQQISGFTWMPSYFQVWSSELKNQQHHHNLSKIEGRLKKKFYFHAHTQYTSLLIIPYYYSRVICITNTKIFFYDLKM